MSQHHVLDNGGRPILPSQRRMNAPAPATPNRGNVRIGGPDISELPADSARSQWPLGGNSSNRQFRNAQPNNNLQPYTFPTPPRQPQTNSFDSPISPEYVQSPPPSAHPSRPTSSRASTVSSIGTIPDFPLPQMPIPAAAPQRRNQNLGPPPSARRPGPNYFPHESYVSPIVEESVESSPRSAAFRASVASTRASLLNDQHSTAHNHFMAEKGESDVPQISTRDDARRLIRQASQAQKSEPDTKSPLQAGGLSAETARNFRFPFASPALSRSRSRSSSHYEPEDERPQLTTLHSFSRSPLLSAEPSPEEVSSPYSKDKHFEATQTMSEKHPNRRRPPRLDIDSVREAEARGSLTSLPELIRRATKLAANLDRGQTASRLGMLDMFNSSEKLSRSGKQSTNESISDMLAAFPPPGQTPTGDPFASQYPSRPESYFDKHGRAGKKHGRRCCGMSLCVFIMICIVLLLLIAAAVLVPVFLIVLPRQRQSQHNAAAVAALSTCKTTLPCSNSGISVVNDDSCQCICVNGFTGSQCTTASDPGCSTSTLTSGTHTFENATLGTSIPRLLTGSANNFSIPLNTTALLSLFSANSLSCTSEDALVSFNSQSSNSKRFYILPDNEKLLPTATGRSSPAPTAIAEREPLLRDRTNTVGTSAGIVFQQSTTKSVAAATSTAASSAPSSTATTPASTSSGQISVSQATLDFASIAVLFVFEQSSNLDSAIKAQQNILSLFLSSNQSTTLDLSDGNQNVTADFGKFELAFANGTILGGRGNGNGSFSTSTR